MAPVTTPLDRQMNRFLLASRALFNGFFAVENPWDDPHHAWDLEQWFRRVEEELFAALVHFPLGMGGPLYGAEPQPIRVLRSGGAPLPVMLSNGPGRYDHPITQAPDDADLRFKSFFDWSNIDRRDNRYVMAQVAAWSGETELTGKTLLIESHYCRFETLPTLQSVG